MEKIYPNSQVIGGSSKLEKIDAPSTIHPAHVPEKQAEKISGVGWARRFLEEASESWNGINQMRLNRDPEHTADGHVLRVNETVGKQAQRLEKSLDKTREQLNQARTKYKAEIEDAAKLADTKHGSEIRQVIREMKPEERHTAIVAAMEEGDTETLAAALTGPAIAAGLTRDQQRNLRRSYQRKVHPKAFDALEAVTRAEEKALDAFMEFNASTGKLGAEQRAAEIRKKQEEARRAAQF